MEEESPWVDAIKCFDWKILFSRYLYKRLLALGAYTIKTLGICIVHEIVVS
jgi:hypothetical protein